MKRSALAVCAVLLVLATGCGGDDEKTDAAAPEPSAALASTDDRGRQVLPLSTGSEVVVPAPGSTGVVSEATPVSLAFETLECAPSLPGVGYDDKGRKVDLVAGEGNQLCLVSLAVTNAGTEKNFFSSRIGPDVRFAALRTADGQEYGLTTQTYDYQGIADSKGQQLASTSDLMAPGQTKYDYSVYEIPSGATAESVVYDPAAVR